MRAEAKVKIILWLAAVLFGVGLAAGLTFVELLFWNNLIAPAFNWPHFTFVKFWLWQVAIMWMIKGIKLALS